jgi:hypothetical protein
MSNKKYWIGLSGILLGSVCLATIYLIEVYGPGYYSTSGSGSIRADGTIGDMTVTRSSELPRIAFAAFYLLLVSLLAALISFFRKEDPAAAFGALAFGLAPVLLMTIGPIIVTQIYFGILLPVTGVLLFRKFRQ